MKEKIEIDGVTYVREDCMNAEVDGLDYVIVRCSGAGCHAGFLLKRDDTNNIVFLVSARRLWQWHGRTLTGLAIEGTDDPAKCKFGDELGTAEKPHVLAGWCEILPCTKQAMESLRGVARWENG